MRPSDWHRKKLRFESRDAEMHLRIRHLAKLGSTHRIEPHCGRAVLHGYMSTRHVHVQMLQLQC